MRDERAHRYKLLYLVRIYSVRGSRKKIWVHFKLRLSMPSIFEWMPRLAWHWFLAKKVVNPLQIIDLIWMLVKLDGNWSLDSYNLELSLPGWIIWYVKKCTYSSHDHAWFSLKSSNETIVPSYCTGGFESNGYYYKS